MLRIGYSDNRIRSIRKLLWRGADAIKFDVRQSLDKKIVLSHDFVGDYALEDLEPAETPLFADVIERFGNLCLFIIEVRERGLVQSVAKILKDRKIRDTAILSSFDSYHNTSVTSTWAELSSDNDGIPIALLATKEYIQKYGNGRLITAALDASAFAIHPPYAALTDNLIGRAHHERLLVHTWTVNHQGETSRCWELGVDGVISHFPEML